MTDKEKDYFKTDRKLTFRELVKRSWKYREVPYKECFGIFDFLNKNENTLYGRTIITIIQIAVSALVSFLTVLYFVKKG